MTTVKQVTAESLYSDWTVQNAVFCGVFPEFQDLPQNVQEFWKLRAMRTLMESVKESISTALLEAMKAERAAGGHGQPGTVTLATAVYEALAEQGLLWIPDWWPKEN